jgi:16S rRNA (cytosine967-C5)-methyltransferase
MGIYQLRHLDRVPPHAAVAEGVELAKKARKRSAAGFVNAVLRKVHRAPVAWPDRATEFSQPPWLLERWDKRFGPAIAEKIARACLVPPETYLRIAGLPPPEGLDVEPTEIPGCFRLRRGDPVGFRIQDIGAQSIVPLLELEEGQSLLDLCAAPGNKTAQALEYEVRAVACDVSAARLSPLRDLGCPLVVLDGTQPLPFSRPFDRILLDAPCSGTGTLGRNPEIRWRLQPQDLDRFHDRQVRLLSRALELLAPGGRLVYSTCSLESEENEQVIEEVAGRLPVRMLRRIPGIDAGDGFFAAVLPSV